MLNRSCSHRGKGEGDTPFRRNLRSRILTLVMHHPGETSGGDSDRERDRGSHHLPRGGHLGHVSQDGRLEFDIVKCFSGASERQFGFGGTIAVIKGSFGGSTLRNSPQVPHGECGLQPTLLTVQRRSLELQQRGQFFGIGKTTFGHATCPFSSRNNHCSRAWMASRDTCASG